MRVVLSTVAVLAASAIGYLVAPGASAQGPALQAGIENGEKIRLITDIDRGTSHACTVIEVRGDFVGCRNESPTAGATSYNRWYNLKLIVRIDRPLRPE